MGGKMSKRMSLVLGASLLLAACTGGFGDNERAPAVDKGGVVHPLTAQYGIQPTLLARYYHVSERRKDDGSVRLEANYGGVRYKPRQSSFKGFEGWDELSLPSSESTRVDWLRLSLNRDARVAVVWKIDPVPLWLIGWERVALPEGFTAFVKDFKKGEVALGGPGKNNGKYTVLLAEAGGRPSAEPALPPGVGEKPLPNTDCPSWLHDSWRVVGPDGNEFQGWHPQIDPIYWCYYRHEHNSDPGLIGYQAAFTYVALKNQNQPERGEGFKGFVIKDEATQIGWYINLHSETSTDQRVCARFHTVTLAATDLRTGRLLLELGYKGDFGFSRENNDSEQFITPNACPDQAKIAQQTDASKRIRVASDGNGGYEQWDGGCVRALGMECGNRVIGIDIQNPATSCADYSCSRLIINDGSSTRRTIDVRKLKVSYLESLDLSDGKKDGYFYTDVYGLNPGLSPDDPGAVRQYVKPGLSLSLDGRFTTEDAWRGLYVRDGNTADVELEGSIGSIN